MLPVDRRVRRRRRGSTPIELLVVIAIIAVLFMLGANSQMDARDYKPRLRADALASAPRSSP